MKSRDQVEREEGTVNGAFSVFQKKNRENKNTSASTVYQKRKKRKGISRPSNESFCLLLTAFETLRATAVEPQHHLLFLHFFTEENKMRNSIV